MGSGHDVDACARKRMSRRYFFRVLGGAAAAVVIAKRVPTGGLFNPIADVAGQFRAGHLRGNRILTPEILSREVLKMLQSNVSAAMDVQRDYNRHFNNIGDSLNVRSPASFRII